MCLSIIVRDPSLELARGEKNGFQWVVTHNGRGFRCGYVQLAPSHPWHGKDWDHDDLNLDVHGGVTFAEADMPCDKPGEDKDWWIGFDCGHGGDGIDLTLIDVSQDRLSLASAYSYQNEQDHPIRTTEYVIAECEKLCDQALDAQHSRRTSAAI